MTAVVAQSGTRFVGPPNRGCGGGRPEKRSLPTVTAGEGSSPLAVRAFAVTAPASFCGATSGMRAFDHTIPASCEADAVVGYAAGGSSPSSAGRFASFTQMNATYGGGIQLADDWQDVAAAATASRSPMRRGVVPPLQLVKSPSKTKEQLLPSVAPTPCASVRGDGMSKPGRATICLPSNGPANDATRVRNGGKALRVTSDLAATGVKDITRGMLRVSSAPVCSALQSPTLATTWGSIGSPPSSPPGSLEKTPRMARGMVRRVSKVLMHYPSSPVVSSSPLAIEKTVSPSASVLSFKDTTMRITTGKRVSWADKQSMLNASDKEDPMSVESRTKLHSSAVKEDGTKTFQLYRSERMSDCLYDLRRVSGNKAATAQAGTEAGDGDSRDPPADSGGAAGGAGALDEQEAQEALLHMTLRALEDTEDDLRAVEGLLKGGLSETACCGGARHATAVMSLRTLSTVQRKAALLHDVETRLAELEAVHTKRDEIEPQLVADTIPVPAALGGIKKFITGYTHGPGQPWEANKSNFKSFVQSFKLPSRHAALLRLRDLADEVGEWWADACLKEAEKGHGHAVLHRLFEVALGTGVDKEHPKLIRAWRILIDRLATRVLADAEERLANDEAMAEQYEVPPVGPAGLSGDKIEEAVMQAIKEGVPKDDHRLKNAEEIMKGLRQSDGERKRLAARQKRLEDQKKGK
eukprot:TRINITY_DN26844_c0_g1_i1.p1 TRINITY_DN26844_c0_g1~~TRINITY_DN26844_c0_g1_i1.p1  ORF type:complete len:718 (+),score=107.30 TRINITY_DN26844_c0_g1_i1:72-2156(+)